jgi:hypothetical protein
LSSKLASWIPFVHWNLGLLVVVDIAAAVVVVEEPVREQVLVLEPVLALGPPERQ